MNKSLLPIAMKVSAKLIGLDIVNVKPSTGPIFNRYGGYKSIRELRLEKLATVMKSVEWRKHKIEELLK